MICSQNMAQQCIDIQEERRGEDQKSALTKLKIVQEFSRQILANDYGQAGLARISKALELTASASEDDPVIREFFLSACTSPVCLDNIRRNDMARAKKVLWNRVRHTDRGGDSGVAGKADLRRPAQHPGALRHPRRSPAGEDRQGIHHESQDPGQTGSAGIQGIRPAGQRTGALGPAEAVTRTGLYRYVVNLSKSLFNGTKCDYSKNKVKTGAIPGGLRLGKLLTIFPQGGNVYGK